MEAKPLQAERIAVADSLEAVNRLFYARNWTDGLPIVPPTEERVHELLAHTDREPAEVLGRIPPKWAEATVELVAINAVMAGCLPEYMPVVLAAVEAVADEEFNLYSLQATTNPVAPLLVVNGPLAEELDINSAGNALGQGWRANATIGRALRLVMMNVGGGLPQRLDKATQGQPGKYSFCIAENEADSPWEPLSVERGFERGVSTVTAFAAVGTHNILDLAARNAEELLMTLISASATVGTNNSYMGGGPLFALCPEHAAILAQDGFSKAEVKRYLYEHARIPLHAFSKSNIDDMLRKRRPKWVTPGDLQGSVTIADAPEEIWVIVVGGAGPHSCFIPSFGEGSRPVTRAIAFKDGTPVKSVKDEG